MSFFDIKGASGRFDGVTRPYTEQDVQRLRGSVKVGAALPALPASAQGPCSCPALVHCLLA